MIARYLITGGEAGRLPAWYRLVKAAQWLEMDPTVLAEKPFWWIARAEAGLKAEQRYRKYLKDHQK